MLLCGHHAKVNPSYFIFISARLPAIAIERGMTSPPDGCRRKIDDRHISCVPKPVNLWGSEQCEITQQIMTSEPGRLTSCVIPAIDFLLIQS